MSGLLVLYLGHNKDVLEGVFETITLYLFDVVNT
jgi:hypothetical protein